MRYVFAASSECASSRIRHYYFPYIVLKTGHCWPVAFWVTFLYEIKSVDILISCMPTKGVFNHWDEIWGLLQHVLVLHRWPTKIMHFFHLINKTVMNYRQTTTIVLNKGQLYKTYWKIALILIKLQHEKLNRTISQITTITLLTK